MISYVYDENTTNIISKLRRLIDERTLSISDNSISPMEAARRISSDRDLIFMKNELLRIHSIAMPIGIVTNSRLLRGG